MNAITVDDNEFSQKQELLAQRQTLLTELSEAKKAALHLKRCAFQDLQHGYMKTARDLMEQHLQQNANVAALQVQLFAIQSKL